MWFGRPLGLRMEKREMTTLHAGLETVWRSLLGCIEVKRITMSYIAFSSHTVRATVNASSAFLEAHSKERAQRAFARDGALA